MVTLSEFRRTKARDCSATRVENAHLSTSIREDSHVAGDIGRTEVRQRQARIE